MHKIFIAVLLLATVFISPPALAATDCLATHMPTAVPVGTGQGKRFVFHAYDATLYAPHGTYTNTKPFALSLTYRMTFSGHDIVRESVQQMRRISAPDEKAIARWQKELRDIFPDVKPGMTITGLRLKSGKTLFCTAQGKLGEIADTAFADHFFGIWLNAQAENTTLRHQLTGQP